MQPEKGKKMTRPCVLKMKRANPPHLLVVTRNMTRTMTNHANVKLALAIATFRSMD